MIPCSGAGASGRERLTGYGDNVPPAGSAGWYVVVKMFFSKNGQFKIYRNTSNGIICPVQLYEETEDGSVIAWEMSGHVVGMDPGLSQGLQQMLNGSPAMVVEKMDETDVAGPMEWNVPDFDSEQFQRVEPDLQTPGRW